MGLMHTAALFGLHNLSVKSLLLAIKLLFTMFLGEPEIYIPLFTLLMGKRFKQPSNRAQLNLHVPNRPSLNNRKISASFPLLHIILFFLNPSTFQYSDRRSMPLQAEAIK